MSLSLCLLIEPVLQFDSGGRLFQGRRQRLGWQRGRRLRLLLLGHCILFLRNRCPQFHRSATHCLCLGNRTDGHGSNRVPSRRRYMNWHLLRICVTLITLKIVTHFQEVWNFSTMLQLRTCLSVQAWWVGLLMNLSPYNPLLASSWNAVTAQLTQISKVIYILEKIVLKIVSN